jgi:hypothetical protein
MNISRGKLNEYITLYLNDMEDYGDDPEFGILAESTLTPLKTLLTETKIKQVNLHGIASIIKNKEVAEDFVSYLQVCLAT